MNNACATIAIVNALGNIPGVTVGPILANLFEFAPGMDPLVSGYTQLDYGPLTRHTVTNISDPR